MKYFIDTEFIEGPQKESFPISLFRKETPNTIDLISIGIVADDGREYYAISKDFNLKEAWNRFQIEQQSGDMRNVFPEGKKIYWLRENVLKPIFYELSRKDIRFHDLSASFTYKRMKYFLSEYGKTNKQIADEIYNFTRVAITEESENGTLIIGATEDMKPIRANFVWDKPEFYAYYADYDWVVFCWLFGKMMNLPSNFPMYCKDLQQMLDEIAYCGTVKDFDLKFDLKNHQNYPKQENEHSAIHDARWNKKLYEFLTKL